MGLEKETNNPQIRSGVAEKTQKLLQNYSNFIRKNLSSGATEPSPGGRIHGVDSYKVVKYERNSKSLATAKLLNDSSEPLLSDKAKHKAEESKKPEESR